MTELTERQIKLAEQLLISCKIHETYIFYEELAERINPSMHWRQVGKEIGQISRLCYELGLPLISAKVVNKNTMVAGDGFYDLCKELGMPTDGLSAHDLYLRERDKISFCEEWYKLEDYLGLHIGFERPNQSTEPSVVPIKPNEHPNAPVNSSPLRLDASALVKYSKSVDVLNTCLPKSALKKDHYEVYKRGTLYFTSAGQKYMVWFPKHPKLAAGWVNSVSEDGSEIREEQKPGDKEFALDEPGLFRLVFMQGEDRKYSFLGVFVQDTPRSTTRCRYYHKIADVADFSCDPPMIQLNISADPDDATLMEEVNADSLFSATPSFSYKGIAKEKIQPLEMPGRRSYPRDRQTAINALTHAEYKCEIDPQHPTFLRRNSNLPYTEPHHIVPMSQSDDFEVSLDVEENIVSLCSNCHNRIHYGADAATLIHQLYCARKDHLSRVEIDITEEQLLAYYGLK